MIWLLLIIVLFVIYEVRLHAWYKKQDELSKRDYEDIQNSLQFPEFNTALNELMKVPNILDEDKKMKWTTKDRTGKEVVWYSSDVLESIKKLAEDLIQITNEAGDCYHKDGCNICKLANECQYHKVDMILDLIEGVQ